VAVRQLTGRAQEMLSDMVGSVSEDVKLIDDAHWKVFPAIGEALKQLGFAEYSMCIAKSEQHSKWAVGVGGSWKRRENSAKLSLCVAIARDSEQSSTLFSKYPDLREFCESIDDSFMDIGQQEDDVNVVLDASDDTRTKTKAVKAPGMPPLPKPMQTAGTPPLPRDVPFWIKIPDDEVIPGEVAGLPLVALAVSTDGIQNKGLYTKADEILKYTLGDDVGQVEYHDDIDWSKLPGVGAGLRAHAESEECFCVASLACRLVWAVGVSMKGKCRYSAAKVALASAVLLQIAEAAPDELPDLEAFPTFAKFFEEVRQTEVPL